MCLDFTFKLYINIYSKYTVDSKQLHKSEEIPAPGCSGLFVVQKMKWHQLHSRTNPRRMKRTEINVKVPEEYTEPKKNPLYSKKRNVMHTVFIYFVQIIL